MPGVMGFVPCLRTCSCSWGAGDLDSAPGAGLRGGDLHGAGAAGTAHGGISMVLGELGTVGVGSRVPGGF